MKEGRKETLKESKLQPEAERAHERTSSGSSLSTGKILPFVEHELLAAEERLSLDIAISVSHELHNLVLDLKIVGLHFAQWMELHELAEIMASNCKCRRVRRCQQRCKLLHCGELICFKLHDVFRPEFVGVNEAPI